MVTDWLNTSLCWGPTSALSTSPSVSSSDGCSWGSGGEGRGGEGGGGVDQGAGNNIGS